MMIWITGDTHGDFHRLSSRQFPEQKKLTRDDYVIILGDFGGVFSDTKEEKYWLDWLESKNFTTLFLDGNHEAFHKLEEIPIMPFHGGMVHQIRPHVYHLCRGHVFHLDQYHFFVMGGAQSHDCLILDPDNPLFRYRKQRFRRYNIPFRVIGETWWPQELPSSSEYLHATAHLCDIKHKDCIVLTHCAPTDIQQRYFPEYPVNGLTDYLMEIRLNLPYQRWYCGHYHKNMELQEERFYILDQKMVPLEPME